MATVAQYVTALRQRQRVIARKLGSDLDGADKQTRVLLLSVLILIAVVIKTLVDKGVVTDAELIATLNTARDDAWPDEPIAPPQPVD